MKTYEATQLDEQITSRIEGLIETGDYRGALGVLRDAESAHAAILAASPLFVEAKARILNLMGDYHQALETAQAGYRLVKDDSDNNLVARMQTEIAKAHLALGRTDLAGREYRDVVAAYRRAGNIAGLIDTLNRLAQISFIAAGFDEARRLLMEALDYAREHELSDRIAKLTGNLGQIAIMLGDFDEAVKQISDSIEKNSELRNFPNLCRAFLSLAYAEIRLANYDSARKSLQRALGLIENHHLTREYGIYFEYRAELEYERGAYDEAMRDIQAALEHAYKLSEASALISQSERMRAEILIQKGDLGEAEKAAVKALEVAEKIGENLEKGAALRVLGEIAGLKHELDHGQRLILRAIDAIRGSSARYDLARAYISAYQLHRGNVGQSQYYLQLARELYAAMKLDFSLSRVLPRSEESRARYEVASPSGEIISIVSVNRRVKAIMRAVEAIKDSDIPILIGGETGTGKDQLAKYIHYSSRRRGGNFIVVNCAAIPPDLAESELFGYVRGAFTNAAETRDGLIAAANGGTLFLNEIGELRPAIQAKLLGVLENRKVLRIGDLLPRPADFRLICATNRDLEEEVRSGAFRQDLFFRIAVMTFELPPLAQRGDDVCELIMHFLKEKGFEITAQDIYGNQDIHAGLLKYDWPGNIRELRNEISLLALSYPGDTRMVLSKLCEKLSNEANQTKIDRESGLAEQLSAFERMKILEALAQSDYVIRKAAQLLKMPEATLRSKIKRHKINIA